MTTLRTSDPDLDRAFELATRRAEALLAGGTIGPGEAAPLAAALLGAGVRAPARALLRLRDAEAGAAYHAWVGHPAPAEVRPLAAPAPAAPPSAADVARLLEAGDRADSSALLRVLDGVLRGLWALEPDAPAGSLALRPRMPARWSIMALDRLRVGPAVLDLELRRRRGDLVARVRRLGGPPLVLTVAPDPPPAGPTAVDDVELAGGRARFQVVDRHEIVFRAAEG